MLCDEFIIICYVRSFVTLRPFRVLRVRYGYRTRRMIHHFVHKLRIVNHTCMAITKNRLSCTASVSIQIRWFCTCGCAAIHAEAFHAAVPSPQFAIRSLRFYFVYDLWTYLVTTDQAAFDENASLLILHALNEFPTSCFLLVLFFTFSFNRNRT